MRSQPQRRSVLAFLLCALVALAALETRATSTNKFLLIFKATLTTNLAGKSGLLPIQSDCLYRRVRSGNQVDLILDATKIITDSATGNRKMVISRDHFYSGERDKYIDVSLEKADPPLKQKMEDSYGTPLCQQFLDHDGFETNLITTTKPGAKTILDAGFIASIRLFHPAFPPVGDTWTSDRELPMGNGGSVRGKFTCTKVKPTETTSNNARLTIVTVTGTLANPEFHPANSPILKNIIYHVTGTQTFDSSIQEWIAADLTMDLAYDLFVDNRKEGQATGTLHATLEKVPHSFEFETK